MRQGTFSPWVWNQTSRPSRWKEVIQSEEDNRWSLMTNGQAYGLQHKCQKTINSITNNPVSDGSMLRSGSNIPQSTQYCCCYCKTPAPDELMAILKLHAFGIRNDE